MDTFTQDNRMKSTSQETFKLQGISRYLIEIIKAMSRGIFWIPIKAINIRQRDASSIKTIMRVFKRIDDNRAAINYIAIDEIGVMHCGASLLIENWISKRRRRISIEKSNSFPLEDIYYCCFNISGSKQDLDDLEQECNAQPIVNFTDGRPIPSDPDADLHDDLKAIIPNRHNVISDVSKLTRKHGISISLQVSDTIPEKPMFGVEDLNLIDKPWKFHGNGGIGIIHWRIVSPSEEARAAFVDDISKFENTEGWKLRIQPRPNPKAKSIINFANIATINL